MINYFLLEKMATKAYLDSGQQKQLELKTYINAYIQGFLERENLTKRRSKQ